VGVRGLPVGPDASAVLANVVLAPVDRTLADEGIEHLRWVDDIVVTAADPRAALSAIRRALERIGLRLNERKTRIVDPASLRGRPSVSGCRRADGASDRANLG
jgi:histidine ammonia-lyase